MVGTTELESVTSCMSSKRSNQLSYAPVENATIIPEFTGFVKRFRIPCTQKMIFLLKYLKLTLRCVHHCRIISTKRQKIAMRTLLDDFPIL